MISTFGAPLTGVVGPFVNQPLLAVDLATLSPLIAAGVAVVVALLVARRRRRPLRTRQATIVTAACVAPRRAA